MDSSDTKNDQARAYYATTPIFYVNAEPHLGHAYTTTLVDVAARFHRLRGDDVFFLTGTDEHGEKIQQVAAASGMSPEEYTDYISGKFRTVWDELGIQYDDYIRTTEQRHRKVVLEVLQRVHDNGDIIFGEYGGLYCVQCERYYTDKELEDGRCPQHDIVLEYRSEENYFFRMERYRPWLRRYLEANPDTIRPAGYRNEVLAMLREPIGDLSISRPRERVPWGIPLPWDDSHVTYVWFDALINYWSALESHGTTGRYWQGVEHFIGKDILKPHGVFWPTMLKSAGLPMYRHLNVHGYWNTNEGKMSKSKGNVIRPLDLKDKYGIDAFRYFLIRDMTFGLDSTFSELALAERINSDLANDLGNLLNRTLGMISRYRDGVVPAAGPEDDAGRALRTAFQALPARVSELVDGVQLDRAVFTVLEAVGLANKYIADTKPWELAKDPAQGGALDSVLRNCVLALRSASILLDPVIPAKAAELRAQLGLPDEVITLDAAGDWDSLDSGFSVVQGDPLFPRVDLDELRRSIEEPVSAEALVAAGSDAAPGAAVAGSGAPAGSASGGLAAAPRLKHKPDITIDQFGDLELRVATVMAAEAHPKADKLLVLRLRLGDEERQVVSGIRQHYAPEVLVGRKLVIVANLPAIKLRGVESQGMILAAADDSGALSVVTLDRDLPDGSEVN